MIEIIVTIILFVSLLGMGVMIYQKVPALRELPEFVEKPKVNLQPELKERLKNLPMVKSFSFESFFQKILSKIRILALKIESKIGDSLQKMREKTKNKNLEDDNYWQEIKNSKTQKTKKTKPR